MSPSAECPGSVGYDPAQQVVGLTQHQLVVEAEEEVPDLPVQGRPAVADPLGASRAGLVQDYLIEERSLEPSDSGAVREEVEPEVSGHTGLVGGDGDVPEGVSEEAGDEVILGEADLQMREERQPSLD